MDLKKTNYFDPRKMAARKRWTVQETGQGLIAMTGYAYLGDEEKTALFSGADLEARIRQASAEKPRETELYLRLSNWLVIRRRETLQLKSHAMQVLQLIWRGLFVDMAQQVIAASELKDERLSAKRQAVAETLSLSDEQLKEGVDILRQNFSTIAAFNVLMTLLSDTYQIDTFGYVIDADDELDEDPPLADEEELLVEEPPAPPPHAARPIMPNPTTHASTFLINTLALRISCHSYSLTEFNAFASFLASAALWATPS